MTIIILEDERHNRRLLFDMIRKIRPGWKIAGAFESVKDTIAWLKNNPSPDLIFMDIQLTDGTCFSLFKKVEVESMVIFTTAYDEYAIQAFEVNSVDYLLKPIREEKLLHAIANLKTFITRWRCTMKKQDTSGCLKCYSPKIKNSESASSSPAPCHISRWMPTI